MNETKINVPEMIELYKSGFKTAELAKKYTISSRGILKHLNKNNVKIRQNKKRTPELDQLVVNMYLSGKSAPEIHKDGSTGLSEPVISKIVIEKKISRSISEAKLLKRKSAT